MEGHRATAVDRDVAGMSNGLPVEGEEFRECPSCREGMVTWTNVEEIGPSVIADATCSRCDWSMHMEVHAVTKEPR